MTKKRLPHPTHAAYREAPPEVWELRALRRRMSEDLERRRTHPTPEEVAEDREAALEVALFLADDEIRH